MTEAKFGLYKLSWPLLAMEWLCWAKMLGNFQFCGVILIKVISRTRAEGEEYLMFLAHLSRRLRGRL